MNDHDETEPTRRRTDVTTIVIALVLLGVAAIGISGDTWWLVPHFGLWLIAGVVALIGLGLIVSSLPRRRKS